MRLQIFQLRSVACRLESIRYRLKAMASRITDHPIGGMLLLLPSQSNPSGGFTNWDASFPPPAFLITTRRSMMSADSCIWCPHSTVGVVEYFLREGWSLEQIAGTLRNHYPEYV